MGWFKSRDEKITDAQSELLDLLKDQKATAIALEEKAKQIETEQKKAMEAHKKQRSINQEKAKKQAVVHLKKMEVYLNRMELTEDPVYKAELMAIVEDRRARCIAAGIEVDSTLESVHRVLA